MARIGEFIKSVLAGVMISVGGIVYLSCGNKYAGALLFSVGLISVVTFGFNLYTGKIGYVLDNNGAFLADTVLSILGNFIGCLFIGLIKQPVGSVEKICSAKLEKAPADIFTDAILCGILIFICVDIFKKRNTLIGILFCIPTFILSGFEHSVADMFYFVNARMISIKSLIFIVIVIAGNAVGGLLIPICFKIVKKCSKQTE